MNVKKQMKTLIKLSLINVVIIVIVVLFVKKPLYGVIAVGFTLLNIFVYKCIGASTLTNANGISGMNQVSDKMMEKSKKLLRYATAILAFLSFYTTTQGMKDFVFSVEWLAYLGSFAVQSILVVFSLLLCNFFVMINKNVSLSSRTQFILKGALVVFFSVSLLVSSTFSYSYIANTAYQDSRHSDFDIIIQNFLMKESHRLQSENNRIGKLLFKDITEKLSTDFEGVIDDFIIEENDKSVEKIKKVTLPSYVEEEFPDVQILRDFIAGNRWQSEASELLRGYDGQNKTYKDYVKNYNSIKDNINQHIQKLNIENQEDKIELLNKSLVELDRLSEKLNSLRDVLTEWSTYHIINDINYPRGEMDRIYNDFLDTIESAKEELQNGLSSENINTTSFPTGISDLKTRYINILNEIALLEIEITPDSLKTAEKLSNLITDASSQGVLSDGNIAALQDLKEKILEYNRYLQLKTNLEDYINNNLAATYAISTLNTANTVEQNTENPVKNEIDEFEWSNHRNEDFYTFFSLIKSKPDVDDLDIENSDYDADAVLYEAQILRRDLLGELTDFERAFDFFKYDFKVMAVFSAFIALFFDLGSFMTGVFLFAVNYIPHGKEI